MPDPYRLAVSLAKPVAAGDMAPGHAHAALICAAVQHERDTGRPAPGTHRLLRFMYRDHLRREQMRLAIADMHARWEAKRHG